MDLVALSMVLVVHQVEPWHHTKVQLRVGAVAVRSTLQLVGELALAIARHLARLDLVLGELYLAVVLSPAPEAHWSAKG